MEILVHEPPFPLATIIAIGAVYLIERWRTAPDRETAGSTRGQQAVARGRTSKS